jgi:hypothetical protein
MRQLKTFVAGTAVVGLFAIGMSIVTPSSHAANDYVNSQDEQQMIQTGLTIAASLGITMNIGNRDPDMVGLGSYLVNVAADCNGCHSDPKSTAAPAGNPYLLPGPKAPFFSGKRQVNAATYLGGQQDFGSFGPGKGGEIISRNLTPGKTGLVAGDRTLADFLQIMKTGVDLDHAHPSCASSTSTNCLAFPFNGDVLQVMPWPAFQNMTDRQLTAIYTYLSTLPCVEGGPGEPPSRCQ